MSNERLIEELKQLLAPLGDVGARKTFGEQALYIDKRLIGLIVEAELYLKTDAATVADYEGQAAFTYEMNGKTVVTAYRRVPDGALDDPAELRRLAGMAFEIASRPKK